MSAYFAVLFIVFFALLVLGVPIAWSIGISSLISILVKGDLALVLIPQRLFVATDSFTLLAIPFFILAGDLMLQGGISKRLINLALSLLGWMKYSMAYVTIAASAFFGAISGSAPATAAAIGSMMQSEMENDHYDPDFAAFLGAISGTLGIIIPPSIALVIFGTGTGTSVSKLFTASAVGGIIIAVVYCLTAKLSLRKEMQIQAHFSKIDLKNVWIAVKDAFAGIFSPIIILGGIYAGIFTPTEAAVIAVVYSLIVGFLVYRELDIHKTITCIVNSAVTSGMVLILVATASLFSWIMTAAGTGALLQQLVLSAHLNKVVFFLIINVIYLVLGMIMETIPIILLTSPIFLPIATMLGIDPIHFGVVTVFNLAFGIITPPFGMNLFVASGYSQRNLIDMVKKGKYYYVIGFALIIILSLCPQLIMWSV